MAEIFHPNWDKNENAAEFIEPKVSTEIRDARWNISLWNIFKKFMEILKYFKTPSLKYFMIFLIFIIKWLKTFKKHD